MNAPSGGSAATWPRAAASREARLELLADLLRLLLDLLVFGDQQQQSLRHGQEIEQRTGSRRPRRIVRAPERCGLDRSRRWNAVSLDRTVAASRPCRRRTRYAPARYRPAGNTSTMPPRTVKAPCSSTGSSREKPASTSRSARRCGSISVPARISMEARSNRSRGLTLGSSAAADATIRRAVPMPRHAGRGPSRLPRGNAASCRDRDRPEWTEGAVPPARPPLDDAPSSAP